MKTGMMVRFAEVLEDGDAEARFIVIEDRDTRVLVQLVCGFAIAPQMTYLKEDLIPA